MRTIIVVQARLGSTRLPGKVLAEIGPRTMVGHVVDRARAVPWPVTVIMTTPPEDRVALCPVTMPWVPHTPPDVLTAFAQIAERGAVIVRLTADCPFLCPDRVVEALARQRAFGLSHVALLDPSGTDVEVFTRLALVTAHRAAPVAQREHVGQAVRAALPEGSWWMEPAHPDGPRFDVDTPADLERARCVHAALDDPTDYSIAATRRAWVRVGRP